VKTQADEDCDRCESIAWTARMHCTCRISSDGRPTFYLTLKS